MKYSHMLLVLVITIIISLANPVNGYGESNSIITEGECGNNINWVLTEDGHLNISGTGKMYNWGNEKAPWYEYRTSIVTINLSDGITEIGNSAFLDCNNLQKIIIPNDVLYIWDSVFKNCSNLKSITISNDDTYIGSSAFEGCSSLETFVIPKGETSIGWRTFYGCSNLESIDIPDGVVYIGLEAFTNCKSLKEIDIPNGITSISSRTFAGCDSLEVVNIPNSVTYIDDNAFTGCSNLEEIDIPDSVTSMGYSVFSDCSSLKNIDISNSICSLNSTFSGCTDLETINIPEGVTSLNSTFSNCTGLKTVNIPKGVTSLNSTFSGCSNLEEIDIPDSVTSVDYAFCYCIGLKTVNIPDSVTSLNGTFCGCSNLEKTDIPDSVVSIGQYTFAGCSSLLSVNMGYNIASIDAYAFEGCSELTTVTVPSEVVDIDNEAFSKCNKIILYGTPKTDVYKYAMHNGFTFYCLMHDNLEKYCKTDPTCVSVGWEEYEACNGCDYTTYVEIEELGHDIIYHESKEATNSEVGWNAYETCSRCDYTTYKEIPIPFTYKISNDNTITITGKTRELIGDIIVPAEINGYPVVSINSEAFTDCDKVTKISLPDSIRTIGSYAFSGCNLLSEINIPKGLTSIEEGLFDDCDSLQILIIPDNIISIGDFSFSGCYNLLRVEIPETVTYIGGNTFSGCDNLIVYGKKGSYVEKFAKEWWVSFVAGELPDIKTFKDISNCYVEDMSEQKVNSAGIDLKAVVKNGDVLLIENIDYILEYECLDNQYTAKIKGIGEYIGVVEKDFEVIYPILNNAATLTKGEWEYIYMNLCAASLYGKEFSTNDNVSPGMTFWYLVESGSLNEFRSGYKYKFTLTDYTDLVSKYFISHDKTAVKDWFENFDLAKYDPNTEIITISPAWGGGYTSVTLNVEKIGEDYILRGTYTAENTKYGNKQFLIKKTEDGYKIAAYGKCIHKETVDSSVQATLEKSGLTEGSHCSLCDGIMIKQKEIPRISKITLSETAYTYNGVRKTPDVTVKDVAGNYLKKDKDYTVSYSKGRINKGTYNVKVVFKGDYSGTATKTFTIKPLNISKTKITGIKNKIYNGNKQVQKLNITYNGKKVTYKMTYSGDRKNIGKRYVKITGTGNYTGSITKSYNIIPSKVTVKKITAAKKKVTVKYSTVKGNCSYQIAYKINGSSKWKYSTSKKTYKTVTGLKSKKYYQVKVRALKKVGDKTYYGSWSNVKKIKIK